MNLSFSTKGWQGYSWEDFCTAAVDMKLQGIELYDILSTDLTDVYKRQYEHTSYPSAAIPVRWRR